MLFATKNGNNVWLWILDHTEFKCFIKFQELRKDVLGCYKELVINPENLLLDHSEKKQIWHP